MANSYMSWCIEFKELSHPGWWTDLAGTLGASKLKRNLSIDMTFGPIYLAEHCLSAISCINCSFDQLNLITEQVQRLKIKFVSCKKNLIENPFENAKSKTTLIFIIEAIQTIPSSLEWVSVKKPTHYFNHAGMSTNYHAPVSQHPRLTQAQLLNPFPLSKFFYSR